MYCAEVNNKQSASFLKIATAFGTFCLVSRLEINYSIASYAVSNNIKLVKYGMNTYS